MTSDKEKRVREAAAKLEGATADACAAQPLRETDVAACDEAREALVAIAMEPAPSASEGEIEAWLVNAKRVLHWPDANHDHPDAVFVVSRRALDEAVALMRRASPSAVDVAVREMEEWIRKRLLALRAQAPEVRE